MESSMQGLSTEELGELRRLLAKVRVRIEGLNGVVAAAPNR
jgi:hypothetical protein